MGGEVSGAGGFTPGWEVARMDAWIMALALGAVMGHQYKPGW